eukprot:5258022-Amphidinium_carterae.3
MNEHPEVLRRHLFKYRFCTTMDMDRVVLQEHLHNLRSRGASTFHLSYIVRSQPTKALRASLTGHAVILAADQVPCVQAALSSTLRLELSELQIVAHAPAVIQLCPTPRNDEERHAVEISETQPAEVFSSTEEDELQLLFGGAPKQPLVVDYESTPEDDPDDEIPLLQLIQPNIPVDISEDDDEAAADTPPPSHITFRGMFRNGRTPYSQPLWPNTSWLDMQGELNRSVRRKRSAWWMFVDGKAVDPDAIVPAATSPHDVVKGELVALPTPLDFPQLRRQGQLCVPLGPTHTGLLSLPVENLHQHGAPSNGDAQAASRSLVAHIYDTSSEDERLSSSASGTSSGSSNAESHEDLSDPDCDYTPTCSSDSTSGTLELRQGAGRGHRLDHVSVSEAAAQKLIGDLSLTRHGLMIEHQCVKRILDTDSKATRAVLQAGSPAQRAAAFSAALSRAGLNALATGMKQAEAHFKAQEGSPAQDSSTGADELHASTSGSVSTDPYTAPP